jgi:hypothetical protein
MPKGSDHASSTIRKALYIGNSGTGKTSSLLSLVKAGKKLRIWNYDALLAPLITLAQRDCPDKLDNIEYMNFRDKFKATPAGPCIDGLPQAFMAGLKAIDKWEDGTKPAEWGSDYVAVFDSGTTIARAAYWWAKGLQGAHTFAEGVPLKGVDPRQFYHTAQQALLNWITYVTDDNFNCNVVYIAHINYIEQEGVLKGFPRAIGSAICDEIPGYFPSVIQATRTQDKRMIRVASSRTIDLKNPYAFDMAPEIPMDTGLAKFFGL